VANSPAPALRLFEGDESDLRGWLRSTTVSAGAARRARIVLLASEGIANTRIAELVGATVVTVLKWRGRYEEGGIAGLEDAARSGRPRHLDHADIVASDAHAAAEEVRGDALVVPTSRRASEGGERDGRAGVAGVWGPAVEVGDVQVLHRSGAGWEGHRCRRTVSRAAGERGRAVCG